MSDTNERIVATTPFLHLLDLNGWYFARRPNVQGVVAVLAVTEDEELLVVEQFRAPVGKRVLELPAGLAGDIEGREQEPLEEAARRELMEETGYACRSVRYLLQGPSSAGLTDEMVVLFEAEGLTRKGLGGGDASEDILLHHVPVATVDPWLRSRTEQGCLVDYKVYAGLYALRSRSV